MWTGIVYVNIGKNSILYELHKMDYGGGFEFRVPVCFWYRIAKVSI
jgi:hypothetical protein